MVRAIVIGVLVILIALPITIFGLVTIAIVIASLPNGKNPIGTLITLDNCFKLVIGDRFVGNIGRSQGTIVSKVRQTIEW